MHAARTHLMGYWLDSGSADRFRVVFAIESAVLSRLFSSGFIFAASHPQGIQAYNRGDHSTSASKFNACLMAWGLYNV